jgi:hypothetical protein
MNDWKTNYQTVVNEDKQTDFKKSFKENVGSNDGDK